VKTITADFSRTDIYDNIANELEKLDSIDVLVNNVGIVYHLHEYFVKIPRAFNENYFNINMLSYVKMIELVLPKMIQQKRGIIINISSQAGERPVPLMATYSASKCFIYLRTVAKYCFLISKNQFISYSLFYLIFFNYVKKL